MRVTALELPARFGDPDGRAALIQAALAKSTPGDLVLLPECALTGYVSPQMDFDLSRFAEPLEGPTLAVYRRLAADYGTHIAGPLIEHGESAESPNGALYNTMVVVAPSGSIVAHYRKRHPWMPETWASAGSFDYPVFAVGGLKCTLAICFDIHFLEREAGKTLDAVDVLLFPSAWVDEDEVDARGPIFRRLRSRFQVSIVNANWGPGLPRVRGQGSSRIVSASGTLAPSTLAGQAWLRIDAALSAKST